jgi:hypothetical protein
VVPQFVTEVLQGAGDVAARVEVQHIDPSVAIQDVRDAVRPRRRRRRVQGQELGRGAGPDQFSDHGPAVLDVHIGDHDGRPLARQSPSRGGTNAGSRRGQQRHPTRKTIHRLGPPSAKMGAAQRSAAAS